MKQTLPTPHSPYPVQYFAGGHADYCLKVAKLLVARTSQVAEPMQGRLFGEADA